MNKVILNVFEKQIKKDAGPKAKNDIQTILSKNGFESIEIAMDTSSVLSRLYTSMVSIPKLIKSLKDSDEIVIQYPIYSKIITKSLFNSLDSYSGKLILIIHDLETLRLNLDNVSKRDEELFQLNNVDGLIVHTDSMRKWLLDNGVTTPMVVLNLFDYLNPQPIIDDLDYKKSIVYAGNLMKSEFLSKINPSGYQLDVFGPNPSSNFPSAINYRGVRNPDELPKELQYNFGLVWDGSTPETCDGMFGEYMRFNSPHKTSLYLSSGLPVIVWKQAAIAKFIYNHKLGIVIDSLDQLSSEFNKISDNDYQQLKKNTLSYAMRLRSGRNIMEAIIQLENVIAQEK